MMVRAAAAAELLAALLLLLATMVVGISACTTEEDCSLLGACTAGACIYDAESMGADRAVLVVPLKHDDEGHMKTHATSTLANAAITRAK